MSAGERKDPRKAYALLVAAGILVSRLSGLARERAISHFMGTSPVAGAFKAALRIPNLLQNLFGEGVLSASFIPVYARLVAEGDDDMAGRVAGSIASILALFVAVMASLGVLASPLLVSILAPGFLPETRELTISMVRILFPGVGMLVLSAWCLGILNSHRRFFLPYAAPVVWNLAMIGTLIVFGPRLEIDSLGIALCWGMVAGSAIQLGIQLPVVVGLVRRLRFRIESGLDHVREVIRNFVPVVFGRGVVQLSAFLDEVIVSFLGASTFAILTYGQTIYLLPISLFAMSVAASELPQMSSLRGDDETVRNEIRGRLDSGLRQVVFFIVPTAAAFVVIGDFLVAALFQTGQFGADDTRFVWYPLAATALALPAFATSRLYSSAFYALRDTRTPVKFAVARVVTAGVIGVLLALVFRGPFVDLLMRIPGVEAGTSEGFKKLAVIGVALGTATGGWLEWVLLRRSIASRLGGSKIGTAFSVKIIVAAAGASVLAISCRSLAPQIRAVMPETWSLDLIMTALALCLVFGIAYLGTTLLLGVAEARSLMRKLGRPNTLLGSIGS